MGDSENAAPGRALTTQSILREIDGVRVAFTFAVPPHDAPRDVREGLTRRMRLYTHGMCPCGAVLVLRGRDGLPPETVHEDLCAATDEVLGAAMTRWRRSVHR